MEFKNLHSSKLESFKDSQRATICLVADATCGTPHSGDIRMTRKLQALKRAHEAHEQKVFSALWLTSCQTLAAEYKYERLKAFRASLKEDKALRAQTKGWHRLLRDDDPQKTRKFQHEVTFNELCGEAEEFFMDQILENTLQHTDGNSSRSWVFAAVKAAVSHTQSRWMKVLNTQMNRECKAIYSSALKSLRKQGFMRYCIAVSKMVLDHYRVLGRNELLQKETISGPETIIVASSKDTVRPTFADLL